jgi:hypothetical protein
MLPVLQGFVDILTSGPETPVAGDENGDGILGPLVVAFTHDKQINEMASMLGVFDAQTPLSATEVDEDRVSFPTFSARNSRHKHTDLRSIGKLMLTFGNSADLHLESHQPLPRHSQF